MAQRTAHTRLAAANETRQQLEDEISRLRAELDRRPQVTEVQNLSHPSLDRHRGRDPVRN